MYIELVRQIVETAVNTYAADTGQDVNAILKQVRSHIDRTALEHRTDQPSINYEDPLCRLGYLYRHAAANATLFQNVLAESEVLTQKINDNRQPPLRICAVGGGPGTELLGVAKYLLRRPDAMPRRIDFTVLDNVPHWAETWQHLEADLGTWLASSQGNGNAEFPIISPAFLTLDVLAPSSYENYMYQFRTTDIVVCNYLFSENKTRLDEASLAIERLADLTPKNCAFIVIDRREHSPKFHEDVVRLFEGVFGHTVTITTYNQTLDLDEQADAMGAQLLEALGYPRIKFFTNHHRDPTVFWFVATREQ